MLPNPNFQAQSMTLLLLHDLPQPTDSLPQLSYLKSWLVYPAQSAPPVTPLDFPPSYFKYLVCRTIVGPVATTCRKEEQGQKHRPVQPVTWPSLTKREETGVDVGVGKKNSQAKRGCHYFTVLWNVRRDLPVGPFNWLVCFFILFFYCCSSTVFCLFPPLPLYHSCPSHLLPLIGFFVRTESSEFVCNKVRRYLYLITLTLRETCSHFLDIICA